VIRTVLVIFLFLVIEAIDLITGIFQEHA